MKTTIEIADPLFEQVKRHAAQRGTTIKALVEQGLRRVLADKPRGTGFKFEPVTDGLGPAPYESLSWAQVRDIIYEGRGT